MSQQVFELVMWIGVILFTPTLYRFMYAASALLWRRVFPTRKFDITYIDEQSNLKKSITIVLPKDKSKTLVTLIDEAVAAAKRENADVRR